MRVKSGLNNHLIQPPQFTDTNDKKKKKCRWLAQSHRVSMRAQLSPSRPGGTFHAGDPANQGCSSRTAFLKVWSLEHQSHTGLHFRKKKKSVFSDSLSLRTNTFCVSSWSLEPSIRVKALKSPTVQPTIPNPFYIQRTLFIWNWWALQGSGIFCKNAPYKILLEGPIHIPTDYTP